MRSLSRKAEREEGERRWRSPLCVATRGRPRLERVPPKSSDLHRPEALPYVPIAKNTNEVTQSHCGFSASASVSGFRNEHRIGIISTPKICSNVSSAIWLDGRTDALPSTAGTRIRVAPSIPFTVLENVRAALTCR